MALGGRSSSVTGSDFQKQQQWRDARERRRKKPCCEENQREISQGEDEIYRFAVEKEIMKRLWSAAPKKSISPMGGGGSESQSRSPTDSSKKQPQYAP